MIHFFKKCIGVGYVTCALLILKSSFASNALEEFSAPPSHIAAPAATPVCYDDSPLVSYPKVETTAPFTLWGDTPVNPEVDRLVWSFWATGWTP